jgi:TonB-dependent receptor
LNEAALHHFIKTYQDIYRENRNYKIDVQDYEASETVNSAYIMTELKWGQFLTFMPGVRYEKTITDYITKVANPNTANIRLQSAISDSSGNRNYGNFLPMVQLRIKPVEWMDFRLAATRSLSRPSYLNLIPYEIVDYDNQTLRYGNPSLKETRANNYDFYVSFYESKWGLFTVGKFYKELFDIDYIRTKKYTTATYYAPYLTSLKGYTVVTPENLPGKTTVDGWEFELQTNLSFLPSPFDGILLYANYSLVHSETNYPYTITKTTYLNTAPYVKTIAIDTTRTGRMIGQADNIANLTIGYEKAGFSARLSMIYQGDALRGVGMSDEDDGLDDAYVRWDLVVQQYFLENFSVILQINNLTNKREETYMRYKDFSTRIQNYGMTLDLGLQYKF